MGRHFLPSLRHNLFVSFDISFNRFGFQFIRLCKNNIESDVVFAQPLHEIEVNWQGFMPNVNQNKSTNQLFPLFEIGGYKFLKGVFCQGVFVVL